MYTTYLYFERNTCKHIMLLNETFMEKVNVNV